MPKNPNAIKPQVIAPSPQQHGLFPGASHTPSEIEKGGDLFDSNFTWLNSPDIAFASWIQSFGYSESTQRVYTSMFKKFTRWLELNNKVLLGCSQHDVQLFLDQPLSRENSGFNAQKTRQREQYLRIIDRVFAHLGELGFTRNYSAATELLQRGSKGKDDPTRFLSPEELKRVIATIDKGFVEISRKMKPEEDWIEVRDIGLLSVMIGGGLKVAHVVALGLNCISLGEKTIELSDRKNTHRARILPFAVEPLTLWLSVREKVLAMEQMNTQKVFFSGKRGPVRKKIAINAATIHRRTQKFLFDAGIHGDRSCAQTLRNTYAGLLIDQGATPNEIMDFLGLRSLESATDLKKIYLSFKAKGNSYG